mgnify:FL=1
MIFSSLLAAGAVFLYQNYTQNQLDAEITALNAEISAFNEAQMAELLEFDARLSLANDVLDNAFSTAAVLDALSAATANSVQLLDLSVQTLDDDFLRLGASVQTDTFDSAIFQKRFFESDERLAGVSITNVSLVTPEDDTEGSEPITLAELDTAATDGRLVTFELELLVPREAVPPRLERQAVSVPITPANGTTSQAVPGSSAGGAAPSPTDL